MKACIRLMTVLGCCGAAAPALGDANDGEYLGYRLGEKFEIPGRLESRKHITGMLVYDLDPGVHPHHVDSMSIYVTPKSMLIGSIFCEWYFPSYRAAEAFADRYLETLRAKYSDWRVDGRVLTQGDLQLWVDVEQRGPFTDRWAGSKDARVAVGLIYRADTPVRREFMAIVDQELAGTMPQSRDFAAGFRLKQ